ncbi:MAG: Riboflavin biosynthesis protein RibF [Thermodesulfobacterium sp. 37_54]|uniref:Riboflavin biosynthesis protein n=1 Tax=Thermodesulfobacterium commune TaxID=1741 RepID=A0A124FKS5_9BACT|nr:bifunctional riboflavin kinase/FAD synthetase [Thermodesulfobacterium commune]KUJ97852.1 MAG: Riboflavin biosynthesis protein RibF [Thermodesulfobacterium sp. 37_54]KUK19628.1 MAG: Riboflavin biosynthesis protein RibF [Thermodesulfobacterium commune]KUK38151.1 MAG: Riboflavin biosynthesis protein RibF [Thermodesulfobacterium commune]HAA84030.1 bifunctional riboflavin kinase/FAD synthetase [Thermodesulfobacterium commune]HBT03954.1 bifunctional riboflavin kinase/FAD synthetase [Thermodesulfo
MKIYTPKDFPLPFETAVTIGSFDGIHLGHKNLFRETFALSTELGVTPLLVSFDPHPRTVLFPEANFKLLTTFEEKLDLFFRLNIEHVAIIPFSVNMAKLTPDLFVEEYLVDSLKAKGVVIGFNFRFGRKREGDPEFLKRLGERFGFVVKTVDPVTVDHTTVSSTLIRQTIEKGDIEKANLFLGHRYFLIGKVIKGQGLGKKLGFPTANIEIPKNKLLPPSGVYAVWVYYQNQRFKGAMNIGVKPTFEQKELTVEVHLLGFNQELYGKQLKVEFVKKIRPERKFGSIEELKAQISKDCRLIDTILTD